MSWEQAAGIAKEIFTLGFDSFLGGDDAVTLDQFEENLTSAVDDIAKNNEITVKKLVEYHELEQAFASQLVMISSPILSGVQDQVGRSRRDMRPLDLSGVKLDPGAKPDLSELGLRELHRFSGRRLAERES